MNILFVVEYYAPHIGGVEVLFQNLCEGLATRGHEVTVITSGSKDAESSEVINGVGIHRVKTPQRGDRYWFTFLCIPKIFRLARDANLIHTTLYTAAVPSWIVAKLRGKPCLITVPEARGANWRLATGCGRAAACLFRLAERFVLKLPFERYVCISEFTATSLRSLGIHQRKTCVVYCGVGEIFHNPRAEARRLRNELSLGDEFVYLYFGRPGTSKGVEYLVQAVPRIAEIIPGAKLLLILGKNPRNGYRRVLETIQVFGVEDKVVLLDPVRYEELPSYIAAADCAVIPSLWEGFGLAAAEACAMGKPVVASNTASLPEVVSGKYVLIEPRSPEAIAEGVEKVHKDEVEPGKRKVFSWDECVEGYLRVYMALRTGVLK